MKADGATSAAKANAPVKGPSFAEVLATKTAAPHFSRHALDLIAQPHFFPSIWTFHKPIEDYVKAFRSAGLLIDAMEEWPSHKKSTSGPRAAAENLARSEIPMFLALRAVKPTAAADDK